MIAKAEVEVVVESGKNRGPRNLAGCGAVLFPRDLPSLCVLPSTVQTYHAASGTQAPPLPSLRLRHGVRASCHRAKQAIGETGHAGALSWGAPGHWKIEHRPSTIELRKNAISRVCRPRGCQ